MSLTTIGEDAFRKCSSLENVDLLHAKLLEIGVNAFGDCLELKSMTIPDSLQTLDDKVFINCSKLVPSNISVRTWNNDTTTEVIAHLRSQQQNT